MKKTISLMLVVVLGLVTEVTKADFICGAPRSIGPAVNSSGSAIAPGISADGLELYFMSWRTGGYGNADIWVTTRPNKDDPWGEPKNLGPIVNSPNGEYDPSISGDGLSLYFSDGLWDVQIPRPGGFGGGDIWVTRRETLFDAWRVPENLGSIVNSSSTEGGPSISSDGLSLFFESDRAGGPGIWNLWVTTRANISSSWGAPVNLGPIVNSPAFDAHPDISADGLALFFQSKRSGHWDIWITTRADVSDAFGSPVNIGQMIYNGVNGFPSISSDGRMLYFTPDKFEIWQAPITPIVDFSGDGSVDAIDMCIMVDHWGENYSLCDIGPMPWGDGIVDAQDLIVLAEHFLPVLPAHWKLDETEGSIAHDSAGDHDGIVNGNPLWQPTGGKLNGALQLDGVDDYVSTPFILDTITGALSAFAWIKGGRPGQVIISQTNGNGWGGSWLCADSLSGRLVTVLMDPQPALASESVITDGAWHHIGLVWDTSYRYLYVDGAEVAMDVAALSYIMTCDGGLYLGAGKTLDANSFFSGLIDDVRIYRRALSAKEIADLVQ